jgi:ArsR family transcriptional regulator
MKSRASKLDTPPACRAEPHVDREAASREAPSIDSAGLERAAAIFRASGEVARLRLLERLLHGERCVTELAAETDENLSTISQRLRILHAEGLVDRRRDGKHIFYSLTDQHVAVLVRTVLEHASERTKPSTKGRVRRSS